MGAHHKKKGETTPDYKQRRNDEREAEKEKAQAEKEKAEAAQEAKRAKERKRQQDAREKNRNTWRSALQNANIIMTKLTSDKKLKEAYDNVQKQEIDREGRNNNDSGQLPNNVHCANVPENGSKAEIKELREKLEKKEAEIKELRDELQGTKERVARLEKTVDAMNSNQQVVTETQKKQGILIDKTNNSTPYIYELPSQGLERDNAISLEKTQDFVNHNGRSSKRLKTNSPQV